MKVRLISQGAITADERFPDSNPDDKRFKRRLLAEGDSWFSLGSVPYENLLMELDFPERTIVVNIAEPGDEIVRMASSRHVKAFKRLVANKQNAYKWDAILLSGGGNDLIDRAGEILRPGTTIDGCINKTALRTCMSDISEAYRSLAAIRDSAPAALNQHTPLIAHTYDYPTPRDSGAEFFGSVIRGPWLFKAFNDAKIAEDLWVPVSDRLIETLADTIRGLASGPKAIPNLKVVETLGTLDRAALGAKKLSGDWRNEIHPWKGGYQKLAPKVVQAVVT